MHVNPLLVYIVYGAFVYIACAWMVVYTAQEKGYSTGKYLALGLLVPFLSLIFVAGLPDSRARREAERAALAEEIAAQLYEAEEAEE